MQRRTLLQAAAATSVIAPAAVAGAQQAAAAPIDGALPAYPPGFYEDINIYPPRVQPGWRRDFVDNFDAGDLMQWGKYGWGYQPIGHGAMGVYKPENCFVENGVLKIRTEYRNGQWTSGGICSAPSFSAVGGRWEICAKMPWMEGLSYAFLLWPKNEVWPPEIDFAEGRANQRTTQAAYHYGAENHQDLKWAQIDDPHTWHTYGVEYEPGRYIKWLFDGQVFGEFWGWQVTDTPMRMTFQTGAIAPGSEAARWGDCVPNGVPGPTTPSRADIEIAWVYHDRRA